MNFRSKRAAHLAYKCGIFFKGLDGLLEVGGGAALLCVANPNIHRLVKIVTREELNEDPDDFIATHLFRTSEHLSPQTQHFAAIYLLGHGIVKVGLVVGLLRKVSWSYPTAIIALSLFIVFQLYSIVFHPSLTLGVLTTIDAVVILLIRHEWKHVRAKKA